MKRAFAASSTEISLLLLSNGKLPGQEYLEYAREWICDLFGASAETPKTILFVPYALKDHDAYAAKVRKALAPLGIDVISAHEADDPVALLGRVDGVFVGGGNTFRLLAELERTGLLDAIAAKVKGGMPYMGASAGINVAGPTIKTTNDMPIVMPASLDAMGLVSFQINPHYVEGRFHYEEDGKMVPYNGESRTDRINQFHEENDTPVVGVREGAALRVKGKNIELLGGKPAKLFRKGKAPVEVAEGAELAVLTGPGRKSKKTSGPKTPAS
jgi:dipeptidase E